MQKFAVPLTLATLSLVPAMGQELQPRSPLDTGEVRVIPFPAETFGADLGQRPIPLAPLPVATHAMGRRLTLKFVDSARARSDGSGGIESRAGEDLSAIDALATQLGVELGFEPLIGLAESKLSALEARAAARSGRQQPDLAGMYVVRLADNSVDELERIGNRLRAIPIVEWVWIETLAVPPPNDIPPTTRDLEPNQAYRGPDPGIDVDYAWSIGARGAGIRLSDCEYGWDADHEDLNDIDIHIEAGQTIPSWVYSNGWHHHGTAVLGETSSQDNGYGCSGIVPDAEVYTWPEWSDEEGARRVTCIANAIADSDVGDVVLLEMQTSGAGGGFGPAELNPAVWSVTKAGTDAGVVVVGAAGNGNQNLDSAIYGTYMGWGDSGAILVGAGSADASHDKLSFSTFGSRINLQGWGQSVFTLGYGSFAQYGGDEHQAYTSGFNGTSSASPFVAGAGVAIQSYALAQTGAVLSPSELRDLLIATGIPQGTGGHIGPFVDLAAALDFLDNCPPPSNYCSTSPNSAGSGAVIAATGSTSLTANDLTLSANGAIPGEFGLFFYGSEQAQVAFGDGLLCIAGGASGLVRVSPPVVIDPFGVGVQPIDYALPPFDGGSGQIQVGDVWNWQFWYRDPNGPGGSGFNTSDGLELTFCL